MGIAFLFCCSLAAVLYIFLFCFFALRAKSKNEEAVSALLPLILSRGALWAKGRLKPR
jgi:hypothetical protein